MTEVLKGLKRRDLLLLCKIVVSEWECVSLRDRKKPYDIMIYYVKEKRETVHFPIYSIKIMFLFFFNSDSF